MQSFAEVCLIHYQCLSDLNHAKQEDWKLTSTDYGKTTLPLKQSCMFVGNIAIPLTNGRMGLVLECSASITRWILDFIRSSDPKGGSSSHPDWNSPTSNAFSTYYLIYSWLFIIMFTVQGTASLNIFTKQGFIKMTERRMTLCSILAIHSWLSE